MSKPKLTTALSGETVKFPTKKQSNAALEIFAAKHKFKIKWNGDKLVSMVPIINAKKVTKKK